MKRDPIPRLYCFLLTLPSPLSSIAKIRASHSNTVEGYLCIMALRTCSALYRDYHGDSYSWLEPGILAEMGLECKAWAIRLSSIHYCSKMFTQAEPQGTRDVTSEGAGPSTIDRPAYSRPLRKYSTVTSCKTAICPWVFARLTRVVVGYFSAYNPPASRTKVAAEDVLYLFTLRRRPSTYRLFGISKIYAIRLRLSRTGTTRTFAANLLPLSCLFIVLVPSR
jgi:hypothetical protein